MEKEIDDAEEPPRSLENRAFQSFLDPFGDTRVNRNSQKQIGGQELHRQEERWITLSGGDTVVAIRI
jgi:hypothetical protein